MNNTCFWVSKVAELQEGLVTLVSASHNARVHVAESEGDPNSIVTCLYAMKQNPENKNSKHLMLLCEMQSDLISSRTKLWIIICKQQTKGSTCAITRTLHRFTSYPCVHTQLLCNLPPCINSHANARFTFNFFRNSFEACCLRSQLWSVTRPYCASMPFKSLQASPFVVAVCVKTHIMLYHTVLSGDKASMRSIITSGKAKSASAILTLSPN